MTQNPIHPKAPVRAAVADSWSARGVNDPRYIYTMVNGIPKRKRNPAAMRADLLALLKSRGPMNKRQIILELKAGQGIVDDVLEDLRAAGEVESYRAMSARKRMDVLWSLAGQAPAMAGVRFRGEEIMAAFTATAAARLSISTRR